MSALAWVRRGLDRPIAGDERRAATTYALVFVIAAALLVAVSPTTTGVAHRQARRTARSASSQPKQSTGQARLTPASEHAADVFLAGYLKYLYGHASAATVSGATLGFIRSLPVRAPRVPPNMRASTPRVLALHPGPAPRGDIGVRAIINDGGVFDYPIALVLTNSGGQLLVSGLEDS